MANSEGGNAGKVIFAFLLGGLVGAGVALLLAPVSGKETRHKIVDAADEAKNKIIEIADLAKEKAAEVGSLGKDRLANTKTNIKAAIEAGKDAFYRKKSELEKESEEA